MLRFRLGVLVGLVLVSSVRAQAPGEFQAPTPTPMATDRPAAPLTNPLPIDTVQQPATPITVPGDFMPAPNDWRFFFNADYALAWLREKSLPPLVTSSPAGTPQAMAGVLFQPNTSVVIGNQPATADFRSMGRVNFGLWFDQDHRFGADAGGFSASGRAGHFTATSDGTTILARPFFDVTTGTQSSVLVAFPGVSSGSVTIDATSQTFWGANIDLREAVLSESWFRIESLFGYRHLHYAESLDMQQNLNATGGAFVPGTKITSEDFFATKNSFDGVEFGFRSSVFGGRWSLELLTKMAVGNLNREIIINGSTTTAVPGSTTTTSPGGVYALSSNIGNFDNHRLGGCPGSGVYAWLSGELAHSIPVGLHVPLLARHRPRSRSGRFRAQS